MTVKGNVKTGVKEMIRKARHDFSILGLTGTSRKISSKTKIKLNPGRQQRALIINLMHFRKSV